MRQTAWYTFLRLASSFCVFLEDSIDMGFYLFLYRYLEDMHVFTCLRLTHTEINDHILKFLFGIHKMNKRQEEKIM